jgi:hypothetical protein
MEKVERKVVALQKDEASQIIPFSSIVSLPFL